MPINLVLGRAWSLVILLSMITVLADVIFASLYNTILGNLSHDSVVNFFIILTILFVSTFWIIIIFVRNYTLLIKGVFMRISSYSAWLIQSVTSAFVIIVLLEIVTGAKYSQPLSSYSEFAGLAGGTFLLIVLLRQLLHSYKVYKSHLLLLYTVAIFSTVFYFASTAALTYLTIPDKPLVITPSWLNTHVYLPISSIERVLDQITFYLQDLSFVLLWIASGFLLRYHFKKRGSPALLILLSIPVFYFIGSVVDISYFISIIGINNVIAGSISIVIQYTGPLIGGVVFGLSFYYAAKSVPKNSKLRTYMNITGHGFILLLVSGQYSIILHYPYPPYGMIAISSTYFGAYLLMVGIYSTALSSAQNIKIHNEISRIVRENSKFSHEMGTAIFINSIEKQVSKIGKRIEQDSGIETSSDPEELRDYIEQIINEKRKGTLK